MIHTSIPVDMIAACDMDWIIGHGLKMPGWEMSDDYSKNFTPKTRGCPLIMGRKTAEALAKPLPGRFCIVISQNPDVKLAEGFHIVKNLTEAVALAEKFGGKRIWIIGGGQIYTLAFQELQIREVHLTRVYGKFPSKNPGNEIYFPSDWRDGYTTSKDDLLVLPKREPKPTGKIDQEGKERMDKGNSHNAEVLVYRAKSLY